MISRKSQDSGVNGRVWQFRQKIKAAMYEEEPRTFTFQSGLSRLATSLTHSHSDSRRAAYDCNLDCKNTGNSLLFCEDIPYSEKQFCLL